VADDEDPEREPETVAAGAAGGGRDGGAAQFSGVAGEGDVPHGGRVEPVDLQTEMQRSYLDYSMSVIVGRALPDVRDGFKPVHRKILYGMYDGGYRPDRPTAKCSRIVGEVMGQYHPHGDSAIYETLVRLAQNWSLRYPLIFPQGNFGSPGNDPAGAMRYTEARMAALAMEMVRDIDKDTVDFIPNYDGSTTEPVILPARFPNLLVNGSAGIAVGMATNIPPHNIREVIAGAQWALENPDATREELLAALMERIPGPDFPTRGLIVGRHGIEDAYRTGRGLITMRGVVEVEEIAGRTCLVITELPYQVNPDNLQQKIADLVNSGRVSGIADLQNDSSSRTGMRIVVVLRRDAVAKVVLNNLYKHTQLQDTFGANMVALVDGVPRTLPLDGFIRHWVAHQIEVIQRRTRYLLAEAERRAHILRGYEKALNALDAVIALIRNSTSAESALQGLIDLLDIDEVQAKNILDLQLRRLAALEQQEIRDRLAAIVHEITGYEEILASPARQREIVSTELAEIVDRFGDERRTQLVRAEGDMSMEDLIAEEQVVVSITRGGYVKRTKADLYRSQRRGGKGVRGASLRGDDVVQHFFVTSTHHWLLFFTTAGRVYRAKAYELPEANRDARGQHVANLLAFQPDEQIAQVLDIADYNEAPYLVLATRAGYVKKTRLTEFDSNRAGGVIGIVLREPDDEVIGAELVSVDDDLLLVSANAQSVRFRAEDEQLRPMGRATSGVTGMRFRGDDELLAMTVIRAGDADAALTVFTVTRAGYAKRTSVGEYRLQGRGGLGIRAMRIAEERGRLVGALVVSETDEVLCVRATGGVTRSAVSEVAVKGRDTMGVRFVTWGAAITDEVIGIARSLDSPATEEAVAAAAEVEEAASAGDTVNSGDGAPSDLQDTADGEVAIDEAAVDEAAVDDVAAADGVGGTDEETQS
jgi:DNA gyrase subunit A